MKFNAAGPDGLIDRKPPGHGAAPALRATRQGTASTYFTSTITFAQAAPMTVKVEAAGAAGPSQDMHAGHAMHGTPPATKP